MAIPEIPLHLLNRFYDQPFVCLLPSNGHEHGKKIDHDWLLAIGVKSSISAGKKEDIEHFLSIKKNQWVFGHFCFEWNNPHPHRQSSSSEALFFPLFTLVEPLCVLGGKGNNHFFLQGDLALLHENTNRKIIKHHPVQCHFPERERYGEAFEKIYHHIRRGDTYELNLCVHMHAKGSIDPLKTFFALNDISEAPHAAFYKWGDSYCIGSSPERFLKKEGKKITSYPMKGTTPRSSDSKLDKANFEKLLKDLKERKENIMVADLARNDLSKIAEKGSVRAEKLCHVETYRQVHQMESVISCTVNETVPITDIMEATFPMASMTGMPKKRVLELISETETTPRNLYSGSITCFAPDGDFDSLVVIRSILYNQKTGHLSCSAGSAITHLSNTEDEYNECRLKAEAMLSVLAG